MLQYNGLDVLFVDDVKYPCAQGLKIMDKSPLHHSWRVADLVHILVPPVELKQIAFFRVDGEVVGMLTWAFFSEEVAYAFDNRKRPMDARDWDSGADPWFVDFIVPDGHVIQVVRAIKYVVQDHFPQYDKARAIRFFAGKIKGRKSFWSR